MYRDLQTNWRNCHPALKDLDLAIFRHMKICCGNCGGNLGSCRWCNGTGLCCPSCQGAGWLNQVWSIEEITVTRCTTCYQGEQYDAAMAMRAIFQYIDDWFANRIEDPVLTRRIGADKERKEREATYTTRRTWKHG